MEQKYCKSCGTVRPLSDFYKHTKMSDGHLNNCKACVIARVARHRAANLDRIRAYDRARYKHPARREYTNVRAYAYVASHPKARRAHTAVSVAIRDGKMFKKPCEVCSTSTDVHAHHDDYDKPLSVRWLCVPHHAEWHQKNGPGKNLG